MPTPRFLTVVLAFLASPLLLAAPTFEVASVKENVDTSVTLGSMQLTPDGGIRVHRLPARFLIGLAFRLQPFQVVNAPAWADVTYYDVAAKAAAKPTRDETFAMMQALLVDRFKLAFHRETREINGYSLVRSGELRSGLRRSSIDCEATPRLDACRGASGLKSAGGITHLTQPGMHIYDLRTLLVSVVGAPIDDGTELGGTFDVDLQWSGDLTPSPDVPSIYTALPEQLGLKLERQRVAADVFVVDRFERPTPD